MGKGGASGWPPLGYALMAPAQQILLAAHGRDLTPLCVLKANATCRRPQQVRTSVVPVPRGGQPFDHSTSHLKSRGQ